MKYKNITKGVFKNRPNRFVANVEIAGEPVICHVKNTGRCRELLIPDTTVYLEKSDRPNRKTAYDLIAVEKGTRIVNMDSQIPNYVVKEWLKKGNLFSAEAKIWQEKTFGNSRFDLYVEDDDRKAFLEVKGVTLEREKTAFFPDAPTLRGVKHVIELGECVKAGYEAYLIFVIQMDDIREFRPNWGTHKEFGKALQEAAKRGVQVMAYTCCVTAEEIRIKETVPVNLEEEQERIC